MKKIGIIGAMQIEINHLKDLMLSDGEAKKTVEGGLEFYSGHIGKNECVVVRCGVGKVNAALCAQRLILEFGCTHIINTGIAGAIKSGLGILDFVVSSDAVYHDMDATGFGYKIGQIPQMDVYSFLADEKMIQTVKKSFDGMDEFANHHLIEGRIATGDQFISDRDKKEKIVRDVEPACVEMEGCAIAHACFLNKIPFVIIRCMSDMADDLSSNGYEFNESIAADLSSRLVEKVIKEI
ncbi:5'-methylthioadenosine/adenosylhomocysteine nucleosidase [Treponema pectinovorum]|uniref:5'-methylthioadenosine/adenosylhomocysteine nucleosidase n=1 Tax=Treponema pectinovorum TaxID=164 RepID=UPI0011CAE23D|nr:5'-methylthioadenosine/adenosylhomocysteine nucleosidase [Treponema pectinovorum]